MNLRRVEANDLIKLLTCNVCNIPENYYMRFWQSIIFDWPDLSFLAEDDKGKVIGYVLSSIEPDEYDTSTQIGLINSLSVLRPYRRLGIAQKLMNLSKDAILREDADIECIQLHVRKSNRAARSLYHKLGYEYHQVETKYYADREDALIMRLQIQYRDVEPPSSDAWRRLRKTWIVNLLRFVHQRPHRFAEATMSFLRRRNSHP